MRIDARTAVVKIAAGAAIVYRSPFRIVFTDARGDVVLREAQARGGGLRLTPPPPGYGPPLQGTLYAALEFTLGAEHDLARGSGTWAGALRITAQPFPTAGVAGIGDSFNSAPGEAFHSFGGRHLGGFMQDFGEEVQPGMSFDDGEAGLQMHNRYPVLYARATRTIPDRYMRRHPNRHVFFYTRAGYSGDPGSAAYANGNFAGDETTDWTRSSGIRSVIPDMLNRAIGGAWGYSTDIGGYFDLYTPRPTTKELLLRWAELAVFTPFFRLHGSLLAGAHTPWRYDGQKVRIYDRLARLHEREVLLILRLWREAQRTGIPPPVRCGSPIPTTAARRDRSRSGCSARTCS